MGTRNLTLVINKVGETKVAQYGQWDGYPSGQGATILNFLRKKGYKEKLLKALNKVRFLDIWGKDRDLYLTPYSDLSDVKKKWFDSFISRDVGGGILENIANAKETEILLRNDSDLMFNSDIEYSYIVDFYRNELVCNYHYNKIHTLETFNLDNLPSEDDFVKILEEKRDEIVKQY